MPTSQSQGLLSAATLQVAVRAVYSFTCTKKLNKAKSDVRQKILHPWKRLPWKRHPWKLYLLRYVLALVFLDSGINLCAVFADAGTQVVFGFLKRQVWTQFLSNGPVWATLGDALRHGGYHLPRGHSFLLPRGFHGFDYLRMGNGLDDFEQFARYSSHRIVTSTDLGFSRPSGDCIGNALLFGLLDGQRAVPFVHVHQGFHSVSNPLAQFSRG